MSGLLGVNGAKLTPLELKLLGNIQANDRLAGVTESDQEVRFALINLARRKLIRYVPERRAQKFTITHAGVQALGEGKEEVLAGFVAAMPTPPELVGETEERRDARRELERKQRGLTLREALSTTLATVSGVAIGDKP